MAVSSCDFSKRPAVVHQQRIINMEIYKTNIDYVLGNIDIMFKITEWILPFRTPILKCGITLLIYYFKTYAYNQSKETNSVIQKGDMLS